MIQFLLDTSTLSLFARGHANVLRHVKRTPPSQIALSTVTWMEIDYGLRLNPQRAKKLAPVLHALMDAVTVLPFSVSDAKAAGTIRADLRKRGEPIGPYDLLLAGCALSRGLTFVTGNVREFRRVDGLDVIDWDTE